MIRRLFFCLFWAVSGRKHLFLFTKSGNNFTYFTNENELKNAIWWRSPFLFEGLGCEIKLLWIDQTSATAVLPLLPWCPSFTCTKYSKQMPWGGTIEPSGEPTDRSYSSTYNGGSGTVVKVLVPRRQNKSLPVQGGLVRMGARVIRNARWYRYNNRNCWTWWTRIGGDLDTGLEDGAAMWHRAWGVWI